MAPASSLLHLRVAFDQVKNFAQFHWTHPQSDEPAAIGRIRCARVNELRWELVTEKAPETKVTRISRNSIRDALGAWLDRFPTNLNTFRACWLRKESGELEPVLTEEEPFETGSSVYPWIEDNLVAMAEALSSDLIYANQMRNHAQDLEPLDFDKYYQRLARKMRKREEEEQQRYQRMQQLAEERRKRNLARQKERNPSSSKPPTTSLAPAAQQRPPLPEIPVRLETTLEFQETAIPLTRLNEFFLRERAAVWWVSNQTDDLLCLPHCRIQQLDYQVRTALRVLGPLRGRALLSDEVGLGKTIEAALVIKEALTRGMVKRFLILTTPSLVDQWKEELEEKFGLVTVTTNQTALRTQPQTFWRDNLGVVASLHLLKQPAHLEIARDVKWDILVVDEAHYLRNCDSRAWQAVNALPRQFLLLLTATPVQNSLEELYNLVTLLQPGQLPTPKEFRARFIDPKRPRQPRHPEELRRLLGQVMIRNTRANAGINLPPRRAETAVFEPAHDERAFWQEWEKQFRESLTQLDSSQASLWGRLLLQAAGSSPAAWRSALESFPLRQLSKAWCERAPLESSWSSKCSLIPPLTQVEGGAVIFTQFLQTQAALADYLRRARIETFVVNGSTPAADRQPITDAFRKHGGALLLTQSGTEGRNLQFSRHLVNFDLPWNPMEIEQRIGRLHRLGQKHPVRIYNFVQAGTLQERLLDVLQEKLNLFELVVGETGLILGERFSSGEFEEEVFRRWRENEGRVPEAMAELGADLAAARAAYNEVKSLDETLFAKDYESV
jgi:SNF2 family DNA or RNA helicase